MNLSRHYKAKRKMFLSVGNVTKAKELTKIINILDSHNFQNKMAHFGMLEPTKKRRRKSWSFRLRGEAKKVFESGRY